MNSFKTLYESDIARYNNKADIWTRLFLFYFRKASTVDSRLVKYWYRFMYHRYSVKHGIEIGRDAVIGKGFYLGHPYNITINGGTIIGDNVNVHKGVTIGRENRGERKGTPVIGNKVWIGVNATVVGKITIGDDVLIAPNSFVNCNVPDHSVVLGNPCRIISVEDATSEYVTNIV